MPKFRFIYAEGSIRTSPASNIDERLITNEEFPDTPPSFPHIYAAKRRMSICSCVIINCKNELIITLHAIN